MKRKIGDSALTLAGKSNTESSRVSDLVIIIIVAESSVAVGISSRRFVRFLKKRSAEQSICNRFLLTGGMLSVSFLQPFG